MQKEDLTNSSIHIDDEQWSAWLSPSSEQSAEMLRISEHVAICAECRQEGDRLRSLVTNFHDDIHQQSTREDAFWTRQRGSILESSRQSRLAFGMRGTLPLAAAFLILLVSIVFPKYPAHQTAPAQSSDAKDEALLLEIQGDAYRQVPSALAPAGLVTEAREDALRAKKTQ